MWLSPSGQVAHTTLDWRLCRTRIFMKRGIEELGAEFVLDEFHISEYIKRMVLAIGEETAEQEIREIIRGGKNKE